MLKITAVEPNDDLARYRLEGRLAGPYVAELGRVVAPAAGSSPRLTLDLSGLTFVDALGIQHLRELAARNVEIHGCSSFVAHLLDLP